MKALSVIYIILFLYGCERKTRQQTVTFNEKVQNNNDAMHTHEQMVQSDTVMLKTLPSNQTLENNEDSMLITIMVPENIAKYKEAMTSYVNEGGTNPASKWKFTPKKINVAYTTDTLKACAGAAAKKLSSFADSVVYLKLKDKTAYVLLEMDIEGWAGVTYTQQKVHPLVEQSLLHFPQIDNVIFDYAPEDRSEN